MDNTQADAVPVEPAVADVRRRLSFGQRSPWWAARRRPIALLSAVAVGAVTASLGVAPAALAEEHYPSWTDVEAAKQNEETKQAEIDKITALLGTLQTTAADAATQSQISAEAYLITRDELDTATTRASTLAGQVAVAEATAATSRMRAGLIAAHLSKTGAQSLSLNLFLNGNTADTLLSQLGTASKLSEQSARIFDEATHDANTAQSLGEQAASAAEARERLAEEAEARFDTASSAAQATQRAFATEQRKSTELFEQLAVLKDSTVEAEREYQAGLNAVAAATAFERAQAAAALLVSRDVANAASAVNTADTGGSAFSTARSVRAAAIAPEAAAPTTQSTATQSTAAQGAAAQSSAARSSAAPASATQSVASPAPTTQAATTQAPATQAPAAAQAPAASVPVTAAPVVSIPAASPPAAQTRVGSPNASAVSTALSFARSQLGDRYQLGGAGPDIWDCSGLTKAAYAAAGIYIGTHSATNQYNTMAARGKLVSFANVQVGDLLFWGSRGNYYHVAIYVGNGQILEAPNPSARVRVHSIWSIGHVAPYVGRPSA